MPGSSCTMLRTIAAAAFFTLASAQTYTQCNPLTSGSCPADPALGKSVSINFASGPSDSFTAQGSPKYDSNGASLTVSKDGDAPQLNSKWYIMFGHVDFVIKAAPGTGIVSSAVLQSDDLDEIDWEWLGGDDQQVQSNYFGKGQTLSYNRGAFHSAPGNHDGFKTYSIDWTADQIVWSIDGTSVRSLSSSTASQYPYPQTPMMIKVGAWCGGCPSNAPGTIQWAGGAANFASGGSTMQVKSINVQDYSTGSQYKYTGTDGTWQEIAAVGGSVNSKGKGGSPAAVAAPVPAGGSGSATSSAPMPFDGTHSDKGSSTAQPNAGGWTPTTMMTSGVPTVTTYPGLPAGWTVSSSGKVLPPSAAAATPSPPSSGSSSSGSSQQNAAAGGKGGTHVEYNGQGFPVVVPDSAGPARYDDRGFLITAPASSQPTGAGAAAAGAANQKGSQVRALGESQSGSVPSTTAVTVMSNNAVPGAGGVGLTSTKWQWCVVVLTSTLFGAFLVL